MSIININEDLEKLKLISNSNNRLLFKKKVKDFLLKYTKVISEIDNIDTKFEYDLNILPLKEWDYFLNIIITNSNPIKKIFFKDVMIKIYDSSFKKNMNIEYLLELFDLLDDNKINFKFNVYKFLEMYVYTNNQNLETDIITDLIFYHNSLYDKPIDKKTTVYKEKINLDLDISKLNNVILKFTVTQYDKIIKKAREEWKQFYKNNVKFVGNKTLNTSNFEEVQKLLEITDLFEKINLNNKFYLNLEIDYDNFDFYIFHIISSKFRKNLELDIINFNLLKTFIVKFLIKSDFFENAKKVLFGLKNYNLNFDIDIDFIKDFEFSKFIRVINMFFNYNDYQGENNSNFKIDMKEFKDGIDLNKIKVNYDFFNYEQKNILNPQVKFFNINLNEKVNKMNINQFLNYLNFVKERLVNEKELNLDELNINYQFNENSYYLDLESISLFKLYNILKYTKINNRNLDLDNPLIKLILIASENKEYKYEKINSESISELDSLIISYLLYSNLYFGKIKIKTIFKYFSENKFNPFKFRNTDDLKIDSMNYTYIIDLGLVINKYIDVVNYEVNITNDQEHILEYIKQNYPNIKKVNLNLKNIEKCSEKNYKYLFTDFKDISNYLLKTFENKQLYGEFDFTNMNLENYKKFCENKINSENTNIIKKFINKKKLSKLVQKINELHDEYNLSFVDKILQLFRFKKNKDNVYSFYNEDMIFKKYNINLKGKWTRDRYIKELKDKHDFCYRDNFESPELISFKKLIANNIKPFKTTYVVVRKNLLSELLGTWFEPKRNQFSNDFYERTQLYIKYLDEPGIDQGGISRMFYNDLSLELKKSKYFTKIDDKCNYYTININNHYEEDDDRVKFYEAIGALVGLCIQRRQVLNIRFDPLLLLLLIEDLGILEDTDYLINELEKYDPYVFEKTCSVYHNLKNISKLSENEWNDILEKKLQNPLNEVENEYYVTNHMEVNKEIDRLKAIKFKDMKFDEKPPVREKNEPIKSYFNRMNKYNNKKTDFIKNKKAKEDEFEKEIDLEKKEYNFTQKKERLQDWLYLYILPNLLKIRYFINGFKLSFSDDYKTRPDVQENLSIRELNYLIMGIDKINFNDFEEWVRNSSNRSDSRYVNQLIEYTKIQSDKSNTYLNTLWQTISGSRNLSIQGFPEGLISFENDVNFDIKTTTCSNFITFNKAIFDDLDSYLSEEKLIKFNKGKTTIGGGNLIKNLSLLNKNNKLKTQKKSSVKNNLKKLSKLEN